MSTVAELTPGDLVTNGGDSATYITHTQHATRPRLQLVVWRMVDGSWSFDALLAHQDIGMIAPGSPAERQARLIAALTTAEGAVTA